MSFKPLKNNVLVKVAGQAKQETESGIILDMSSSKTPDNVEVVAIGSTVSLVKEGDVLLIDWTKAKPIAGIDKQFVISEDHIIAVFE